MKNTLLYVSSLLFTLAFCNSQKLEGVEYQTTSPDVYEVSGEKNDLITQKMNRALLQSYNRNYRMIITQITRGNEWLQMELKELGKLGPCSFSRHGNSDLGTNSADYIMNMINRMRIDVLDLLNRVRFYERMELCSRS